MKIIGPRHDSHQRRKPAVFFASSSRRKKGGGINILAVETSCDETAIAIVEASGGLRVPKFKVIESVVASQIKIHRPWGGVVPNLAKREHLRNLPILFKKLTVNCSKSKIKNLPLLWERIMNHESRIKRGGGDNIIHNSKFIIPKIDLIAVTVGPGLEPALWTGITFAEELAKKYHVPVVGANHLEGHLYSFLLPSQKKTAISNFQFPISKHKILDAHNVFPAVALIVSGGHTILLKLTSLSKWKKLGETRDDAAGECFDKSARLLGLPYPGGPEVEKLAKKGNPDAIPFPRPMMNQKNHEFSFSGLKTSVLYYLRDHPRANKADVAASLQEAITETLVKKAISAGKEFKAKSIILCGGVAANNYLRSSMQKAASDMGINFFVPDFAYNGDNAVMIAAAGYMAKLHKKKFPLKANGNLGI